VKPFRFLRPASLAEAVGLLAEAGPVSRAYAGGSDLLGELKEGLAPCDRVVSLATLPELTGVAPEGDGLRLGAMVTVADLVGEPLLKGPYAVLAQAAQGVATPEIRNQGTLGGNLCQRPRCLHYRSALADCRKRGGTDCPARESRFQAYLSVMGEPDCVAVHPSDLALPLLTLEAEVVLTGPAGERSLPVADFFTGPENDVTRETALAPGEVLTAVRLPPAPAGWRGVHRKERERTAGDFAVVGVAAGAVPADGALHHVRLALGGLGAAPARSAAAEAVLEGQAPTPALAERAADAALADARPLAHNGYKLHLARALICRAVETLVP